MTGGDFRSLYSEIHNLSTEIKCPHISGGAWEYYLATAESATHTYLGPLRLNPIVANPFKRVTRPVGRRCRVNSDLELSVHKFYSAKKWLGGGEP
jgi:hypothetical protein